MGWLLPFYKPFIGAHSLATAPIELFVASLMEKHKKITLTLGGDSRDEFIRTKGSICQKQVCALDIFQEPRSHPGIVLLPPAGLKFFPASMCEVGCSYDSHRRKSTTLLLSGGLWILRLVFCCNHSQGEKKLKRARAVLVSWVVTSKAIKPTGLACVALLTASCASGPYYGNNGYGGGNFPHQGGGIDTGKTAALVAADIAGLSLYHYGKEKDKRQAAERERERDIFAYGNHQQDGFGGGYRGYGQRGW